MIKRLSGISLRAAAEGRTIEGIAVPYGEISALTPYAQERMAPASFKRTADAWAASKRSLKLLRCHSIDAPCGIVTGFEDRPEGLWVQCELSDTALGRSAAEEVRAGLLDSFSVGFKEIRFRDADDVHEVLEAQLVELSLVPVPAYAGAELQSIRQVGGPYPFLSPAPLVPVSLR